MQWKSDGAGCTVWVTQGPWRTVDYGKRERGKEQPRCGQRDSGRGSGDTVGREREDSCGSHDHGA